MNDEKIFAQLIIERVKNNCKNIEIEIKTSLNQSKKYDSYKIPNQNMIENNGFNYAAPNENEKNNLSTQNDVFVEIEVNSNNNLYTTENTPKPIKLDISQDKRDNINNIQSPEKDEKRELFLAMRDIARANNSAYFLNTKFYNKQVQHENSKIFYKQAQFMKDFEDDYDKVVPFSSYFPYYQSMNYEQLRTYFTWRSKVRRGNIEDTSLSYAFIYIYELLNNIGVEGPSDGLNRLLAFWEIFTKYDSTIDKYIIKWIKDYHIYYELPLSFKDFLINNKMQAYYPDIACYEADKNSSFERLSSISRYNIKKSTFYQAEKKLVEDCFDFVINRLKSLFLKSDLEFDNMIFQASKSKIDWIPFEGALFYQHLKQTNRLIVLSNDEVYTYNQNKCLKSVFIARDSGRYLITYVFKQMEVILRKLNNYKFKITANVNIINTETLLKLGALGISIEKVVTDASLEFYAERNKTIVTIDKSALNKIRVEALQTQEKLSIDESNFEPNTIFHNEIKDNIYEDEIKDVKKNEQKHTTQQNSSEQVDVWHSFKSQLNEIEIKALNIIIYDDSKIKKFADENSIMIEVLVDSINEKAFDSIGDNILEIDTSIIIYDEYLEKLVSILTIVN